MTSTELIRTSVVLLLLILGVVLALRSRKLPRHRSLPGYPWEPVLIVVLLITIAMETYYLIEGREDGVGLLGCWFYFAFGWWSLALAFRLLKSKRKLLALCLALLGIPMFVSHLSLGCADAARKREAAEGAIGQYEARPSTQRSLEDYCNRLDTCADGYEEVVLLGRLSLDGLTGDEVDTLLVFMNNESIEDMDARVRTKMLDAVKGYYVARLKQRSIGIRRTKTDVYDHTGVSLADSNFAIYLDGSLRYAVGFNIDDLESPVDSDGLSGSLTASNIRGVFDDVEYLILIYSSMEYAFTYEHGWKAYNTRWRVLILNEEQGQVEYETEIVGHPDKVVKLSKTVGRRWSQEGSMTGNPCGSFKNLLSALWDVQVHWYEPPPAAPKDSP